MEAEPMATTILDRLNADIAAYNERSLAIGPHRTDLHELYFDLVAGLERGEWTRDELIKLVDAAAVQAGGLGSDE
jgi:hypothetical protein